MCENVVRYCWRVCRSDVFYGKGATDRFGTGDGLPIVLEARRIFLVLNRCKACGYLLPDVDPDRFANDLLVLLYENSLRGARYTTQWLFCQALLRGIFRTNAIPLIDEYMEEHDLAVHA